MGNTIQSDGYSVKDVEKALTVPVLQEFLGTKEESGDKLWTMLVDKFTDKPVVSQVPTALAVPEVVIKRRGRPAKIK